ncbi:MAG: PrgI family protein [Parcubacteria group bacterium]|nr:PrgI family protein [Parcubacteria group bacterium]
MQFQVPQFIEREALVVGPLTFRQFAFLAVAGGAAFILYFFAPLLVFAVASLGLAAFGFLTAFVQIGGKSLPAVFIDFLSFQMGGKIYYWKKKRVFASAPARAAAPEAAPEPRTTQITLSKESKISKLSTKIES